MEEYSLLLEVHLGIRPWDIGRYTYPELLTRIRWAVQVNEKQAGR